MESTLLTHKNKKAEKVEKTTKTPRVKWTENAIKALLSFLIENKERLEELKYKRGATSNPENVQLWKDAEKFLLDFNFEQSYSNVQIANKWKNLVDTYKLQLAASKKSGGSPIIIQYKDEIEEILNKNRPILNPKSCIDSSASLPRKEESDDGQEKFEINNKKDTSYELSKIGRKHTNKHEDEAEDNQDRKKPRNNKTNNLENTIQRLLEQQEARQIESDKRREEQRSELLQMKQQNDLVMFNLLNNLTNCLGSLSSLHERSNNQSVYSVMNVNERNEDNLPQFFTPSIPLPSFAQFNNTVNSMGYQNNMDDNASNDIKE